MTLRTLTHRPFAGLDKAIKRAVRTGHGQVLHNGTVETNPKVNVRGFWTGPQTVKPKQVCDPAPVPLMVPLWSCVTCATESKQTHQAVGDSFPISTMCSKCRKRKKTVPTSLGRPFMSMQYVMERYGSRRVSK